MLGAMFTSGFAPWGTFETLFTTMTGNMNLNIIIFDVLLGMIIVLMSQSGGSSNFQAMIRNTISMVSNAYKLYGMTG